MKRRRNGFDYVAMLFTSRAYTEAALWNDDNGRLIRAARLARYWAELTRERGADYYADVYARGYDAGLEDAGK